jgi:hypothetical protein
MHDDEQVLKKLPTKVMSKTERHHVTRNLRELADMFRCESKQIQERIAYIVRPRPTQRKPGPWRIIELFTWTCMVSIVGSISGWHATEPITLPTFDLLEDKDQEEAWRYLLRFDPDFVVVAWPCTPWSQMQRINRRTPYQIRQLNLKKQEGRILLKFVNKVVRFQVDRQRAVIGENPDQSLAWQEPPIMAAFEDQSSGKGDMCMFKKTRPDNSLRVKKRTRFEGTYEVVEAVSILCDGSHEHSPIEGNMKIDGRTCR